MGRSTQFANREPKDYSLPAADRDIMGDFNGLGGERHIPLADVIVDYEIQARDERLNEETVQRYMDAIEHGDKLPAIDVYEIEEGQYLLSAGFHRTEAHKRLEHPTILAKVKKGTRQDAIDHAFEDNLKNGLPFSNRDKRSFLFKQLRLKTHWAELGNRELARRLKVNHTTVGRWIEEFQKMTGANAPVERATVRGADGRVYDTTKIQQANKGREKPVHPARPIQNGNHERFIAERLEKLAALIHDESVKAHPDTARLERLRAEKERLEKNGTYRQVETPHPLPLPASGEGSEEDWTPEELARPDGPPYVSLEMADNRMQENTFNDAMYHINAMSTALMLLTDRLNQSAESWSEGQQSRVKRAFVDVVNDCGLLLAQMKNAWGM